MTENFFGMKCFVNQVNELMRWIWTYHDGVSSEKKDVKFIMCASIVDALNSSSHLRAVQCSKCRHSMNECVQCHNPLNSIQPIDYIWMKSFQKNKQFLKMKKLINWKLSIQIIWSIEKHANTISISNLKRNQLLIRFILQLYKFGVSVFLSYSKQSMSLNTACYTI